MLRVRLVATGRAAHSSFPELGESAIDKLLDALMVVRGLELPDDPGLDAPTTPSGSSTAAWRPTSCRRTPRRS